MAKLVLITGPSGSGKTTVVRQLTKHLAGKQQDTPIPHITYADERGGQPIKAVRLGRGFHTTRSGLDTLDPREYHRLNKTLRKLGAPLILADGNQLLRDGIQAALRQAGVTTTVVRLVTDDKTTTQRRAKRGGYQPTGQAKRSTATLLDNWEQDHKVTRIETTGKSPEQVAHEVATKTGTARALGF